MGSNDPGGYPVEGRAEDNHQPPAKTGWCVPFLIREHATLEYP